MTRVKEYFTSLKELDFYIELGDNAKYHPIGIGTVNFRRESGKPLLLEDVLYLTVMIKTLITVATFKDRGYIVTFDEVKVYTQPKNSKEQN